MTGGRTIPGILMLAGIAAAFAVGYAAAKISAVDRDGGAGSETNFSSGAEGTSGRGNGRISGGAASWEKAKEELTKRWEASPAMTVDFGLREETFRLLERIPVADLEAWLPRLRSVEHIDDDKNTVLQLREMVLMALAPRCAESLIRSLAERPAEEVEHDVWLVVDAWMKHDPAAALALLDSGDLPQAIKDGLESMREDVLLWLSVKDSAEFERHLSLMDEDGREGVLERYAHERGTAAYRAGILERAARSSHGEAMALWSGLMRRYAADSPSRAYATLGELEISGADRSALDEALTLWLMKGYPFQWDPNDKSAIMEGWVRRNPGHPVPGNLLEAFENWCRYDSEGTEAWIAGQPSGPQYDAFAKRLIGQRADESESDHPAVAEIAGRITDQVIRGEALRRIKESWRAKDAAAAAEWEAGLPPADRERLR